MQPHRRQLIHEYGHKSVCPCKPTKEEEKKKKKRGKLINSILLAFVSHGDRESITKTKKRTE